MMKRTPVRDIIWLFLITRLLLVLVTYFGYILLTADKYSSTSVSPGTFLSFWNQWDATRYVSIAQYGYKTPFDFAFFPLFPLLTGILSAPLGSWSYLLVGMLISNGALLGTLFVLYQIAVDQAGEGVARRSLLYLCIFPTAFFFFTAYNESLFLLLVTGAFLAMRRQRWWLVGILGSLAALTRSAGLLLVAPYLYELWQGDAPTPGADNIVGHWRVLVGRLAPILLIPLGTCIYSFYCWRVTGNPLEFAAVQDHWARQLSWPWVGFWHAGFELFLNQPFGSFNQVHILLDLCATIGFIVLTILGWRRIRVSYSIWMVLLLLYILLTPSVGQRDPLISNQRFVLEMFPAFVTLALISLHRPRLHQTLLLLFPILLATLSLLFVMGRWMV
jgi:Gpi18-like mannosyltransferase